MLEFVVLHYQAIDETINCINAIKENIVSEKSIIIVDNNSPNHSGQKLQSIYADDIEVKVYISEENLGFARGNNLGYSYAKKDNPDYIIVMNSDVIILKQDLEKELNNAREKYDFDVLGPDIFSTRTQNHQNPQRKDNYSLKELIKQKRKLKFKNIFKVLVRVKCLFFQGNAKQLPQKNSEYQNEMENCVLHGSMCIFSQKFFGVHENCFWNETFMYYESYILHYLGQREGLKFLYWPYIKAIHHEDKSTDATYTKVVDKVLFVNRYLLDSCNKFIRVMKDESIKIG